jgi:hypothetical protein
MVAGATGGPEYEETNDTIWVVVLVLTIGLPV